MNRIFLVICAVLTLILQAGCSHSNLERKNSHRYWRPHGGTPVSSVGSIFDFEVKKAMLECGYANPEDAIGIHWICTYDEECYYSNLHGSHYYDLPPPEEPPNERALKYRCMIKSGFQPGRGVKACDERSNDPPACKLPEDQIPGRSIERRMNSSYCQRVRKMFPESVLCTSVPRPLYEHWEKPGVSEFEIKKALIECGFAYYDWNRPGLWGYSRAESHLCMEKSGFKRKDGWLACREKELGNDPSCDPLRPGYKPPPKRSVERRLYGHYCVRNQADDICKK